METSTKEMAQIELEELELITSMLSKSVHDINNPLSVIIGQVSIIETLQKMDKLTPDKLNRILEIFKSSTDKFQSRINGLRAFYKVINGEKVDVDDDSNCVGLHLYTEHGLRERGL